ncbi:MAG: hypothetical protein IPJ65_11105 [Archangiaceae bacterium]|nr:hypothetical protein [Archangiaceae bacterium]
MSKDSIGSAPPPKPPPKAPQAPVTVIRPITDPKKRDVTTRKDSEAFGRRGAKRHVPAAIQKETIARIFKLGALIAEQKKLPVVMIDHRQAGLDEYPVVRKAFEAFVKKHAIAELADLDDALRQGTLKYLPGYTVQASDHWRLTHQQLFTKYGAAFGALGTRIDMGFLSYPVVEANATAGLHEFESRYKYETQGRGELVFCGAGNGQLGATVKGTTEELKSVYTRPKELGGGGLVDPDVRYGAPEPSDEAWERALDLALEYEETHPQEGRLELDGEARSKAGWVEQLERESRGGMEKVVIAVVDDREQNRVAARGAAKLGPRMLAVKAVPEGLSYSQADNYSENQLATFHPNPL